ncbi:MAG: NUDIX hydrolase [Cohaesibacter sp.]|jgi:nudix-type nucleoside diphosphatase (YffH/AdpP family)|nr:NUDIX hydrolase [Cohaesibacter sp.]
MTVRYDILNRDVLCRAKGELELVTIEATHADGREHITCEPVWTYGDSVSVLPFDRKAGTVLLVRQMRPAVYLRDEQTILEACAGGVEDKDSSIEAACRREAMEELGVSLPSLKLVASVFINPARLAEKAHLFLASYISGQQNPDRRNQDADEDIEVVELSISDLLVMRDEGSIRCPRLLMLTQALMLDL